MHPACYRFASPAQNYYYVINSENLTIKCAEDGHWCPKDLNYTNLWSGGDACVNRICNDDTLAAGEQCDRSQLGSIDDCTDLGYAGGALGSCDSLCNFGTSTWRARPDCLGSTSKPQKERFIYLLDISLRYICLVT